MTPEGKIALSKQLASDPRYKTEIWTKVLKDEDCPYLAIRCNVGARVLNVLDKGGFMLREGQDQPRNPGCGRPLVKLLSASVNDDGSQYLIFEDVNAAFTPIDSQETDPQSTFQLDPEEPTQ